MFVNNMSEYRTLPKHIKLFTIIICSLQTHKNFHPFMHLPIISSLPFWNKFTTIKLVDFGIEVNIFCICEVIVIGDM